MCIMLPLFLHAGVLCVLLWLVTRGTADIEFWRVFFIAFGISILGRVTGLLVGDVFLALLALVPILGLLAFLLMKYCCATLQQSLIVTGLYFGYHIGFAVLMMSMLK